MKKLILLLALLSCLAPVYSETASNSTFVCFTKEDFLDFFTLVSQYRDDSANAMIESGECAKLDKGAKYKVLAKDNKVAYIDIYGIKAWMIEAE